MTPLIEMGSERKYALNSTSHLLTVSFCMREVVVLAKKNRFPTHFLVYFLLKMLPSIIFSAPIDMHLLLSPRRIRFNVFLFYAGFSSIFIVLPSPSPSFCDIFPWKFRETALIHFGNFLYSFFVSKTFLDVCTLCAAIFF